VRILRVLIAALIVALIAAAGGVATAETAYIPGTFTARPVRTGPTDASTHGYFTLVLSSGQSATRQLLISNPAAAPLKLLVSGVDGVTGQTSGAVYKNRQDQVKKAGRWLTSFARSLTVAGGSSRTLDFTVTVPPKTIPGDHLAGIAVENSVTKTTGKGFRIKEVLRTVVGVLIRVPGSAGFRPRIDSVKLQKLPGPRVGAVTVRLRDSGRALGKPVLTVALQGPRHYKKTIHRTLDTLLPGDAISYPLAWPDNLPAGKYRIKATLVGNARTATMTVDVTLGTSLRGVRFLSLHRALPAPPAPATRLPWAPLGLAGLIGIGGGIALRGRSRGAKRPV
jgi:hypothetical protein